MISEHVIRVQNNSFRERLRLNKGIVKNRYWVLPVDDVGHENYVPVGRGLKRSEHCGQWMSFSVCRNKEGHKGVFVNGVDVTGKVVVRHNHMFCTDPHCVVCFINGWSMRGARNINSRIEGV